MILSFAFFFVMQKAIASPREPALLGAWHYTGFQYDGHRYPNPNPKLLVRFTFREDGTAHLYYNRQSESGICERISKYDVEGDVLRQEVIWVNPRNDVSCARDPDMQMGQKTETRIVIVEPELHMYLLLNGRDFIYILERGPGSQI